MQISLRSHLIAGTAAVIGASAIAITPAVSISVPAIHAPSMAEVALSAFSSPLAQVLGTLDLTNNYLLDSLSNPLVAANWPGGNFGTTFGSPPANYPLLPAALEDAALGGYSSVGLVSQFIDDALPIIAQLGYNGLGYLNVTGNALFFAGETLSQSAWTAVGQAVTGDFAGAVATISAAVNDAGTALLAAGSYVFNSVIAKASAVVATLVGSLPQLLTVTAAQVGVVAATVTSVITNTVTALSLGNVQGAWNAAVDGLLGPGVDGLNSVPGALLNLSIGAGVQTGPIETPDAAGIAAVFVPSTRTVVQSLSNAIVADLQTPAPAAAVAAAKTTARSAAAVAAPAESAASADSSAAAEKPAKARAPRSAAKRAAAAS